MRSHRLRLSGSRAALGLLALGGGTLAVVAAWLHFGATGQPPRAAPARVPAWSWDEVRSRTGPLVARVTSRYRILAPSPHAAWVGTAGGSGVLIAPTLVLTSSHLMRPWREAVSEPWQATGANRRLTADLEAVAVQFPGQEAVPATLFAIAAGSDLALLQIPARPAAPLALGSAGKPLRVADEVAVLSQDALPAWTLELLTAEAASAEPPPAVGLPLFLTARVLRITPDERNPLRVTLDRAAATTGGGGAVVDRRGALVALTLPRFEGAGTTIIGGRSLRIRRYRAGTIEVVPREQIAAFLGRAGVADPGAGTLATP